MIIRLIWLVTSDTVAKRLVADCTNDPRRSFTEALAKQAEYVASQELDIDNLARSLIASMPIEVKKYREGKKAVLARLVGQGMRQTRGAADAATLGETLERLLRSS